MKLKGAGPLARVDVPPQGHVGESARVPLVSPVTGGAADTAKLQPDVYVNSLGANAALARWVDDNYGNRDGILSVAELQAYVQAQGNDPRQHNNIIALAMSLGVPTVQVGNQVALAHMNNLSVGGIEIRVSIGGPGTVTIHHGGGGGGGQPQVRSERTTHAARSEGRDAWSVAQSLVRKTQGASQYSIDECVRSLAQLPMSVLRILERRGTTVIVASTITEYRPDLRFERPRGWPPGSTWVEPAGMHDPSRNEIVLANGGTAARVVFHEVGHALDVASGRTRSRDRVFLDAYDEDYRRLQRNGETYLLQPGDAGPSEAFAESCMWFHANPSGLRASYPSLYAYWADVVGNGYRAVGG